MLAIYQKEISSTNVENFKKDLVSVDWDIVYSSRDCNESFDRFINILKTLYDKKLSYKKGKLKCKANVPPWMSKSLIKACRNKNKMYKTYIKCKTDVNEQKYKCYKNRLTSILKFCEKKYYSDLFVEHSSHVKKTWGVLNEIIKKKRSVTLRYEINLLVKIVKQLMIRIK